MDTYIEQIQAKSEMALRAKKLPSLLSESYEHKVDQSNHKITEFKNVLGLDNIYVSTSGGKDSAVVSSLAKRLYPGIKHYMFDTGLEYQATKDLARRQGAEIIKPRKGWVEFCEEKGYPIVSKQVSKRVHDALVSPLGAVLTMYSKVYHLSDKWLHLLEMCDFPVSHRCCDEFKKKPAKTLQKKVSISPIIGTRVQESSMRKNAWKKSGCNSYTPDGKHGVSRPISLWKNEDVDRYVKEENVELSEIYTQYEAKRTGCIICPFGAHLEQNSRFELLKRLEPKRYAYFIRTKLKDILALQGVKIPSDKEYMEYYEQVSKQVQDWHKDRDYYEYKKKWLLDHYSKTEILDAVHHLGENNLLYPLEQLEKDYDSCTK